MTDTDLIPLMARAIYEATFEDRYPGDGSHDAQACKDMADQAAAAHTVVKERIERLEAALRYARESLGDPVPLSRRHVARRIDAALTHKDVAP